MKSNPMFLTVAATALTAGLMVHAGFAQEAAEAISAGAARTELPLPETAEFMAAARKAFAQAPAAPLFTPEELARPGAMGSDWELHSSAPPGDPLPGVQEILYVAAQPLLDFAQKDEIVLNLKVFPGAAEAREWVLARAFSGAAPSAWLVKRAAGYFGQAGSPGEFCFGPELFVRANVAVTYGSDITPAVSERVDARLRELMAQKAPAGNAPAEPAGPPAAAPN